MNKKKTIIALAIANLFMLPVTILVACGPDNPEVVPDNANEPDEVVVSAAVNAIGAALDRVVALPENQDPVHQGSRTFEVSGHVLVRAAGITADGLESVVRQRGWTFVDEGIDPRICDGTTSDSWGWPHCVLGGSDPNALYLDIRSVEGTESDGFEVAVWAYRNVSVPFDRHLAQGVGLGNDSEYDRLVTQLSDHPGVLNGRGLWGDPGTFKVAVDLNGATSHEYKAPGQVPYLRSSEDRAWNDKWSECHELRENGDQDGFRECQREHWEMGKAILESSREQAEAAVVEAEKRVRK